MNEEKLSKEFLKRYLLGELNQREAELVETQCFADPAQLCDLEALRDDLLDAWVRGELPAGEEQKLNAQLQTLPALRDKAAFARSLQQALAPQPVVNDQTTAPVEPPQRLSAEPTTHVQRKSWVALPRLVWAAAALLFVLLIGWVGIKAVRWRAAQTPEQTQAQIPILPTEATKPPLKPVAEASPSGPSKSNSATVKPPPTGHLGGTAVVSFVLSAGLVRAEQDAPELLVPAAAETIRLQLELAPPDDHPQRAVLKNAANTIVWEQRPLRTQVYSGIPVAICDVPVALLVEGTYQLHLLQSGAGTAVYYFRFKQV